MAIYKNPLQLSESILGPSDKPNDYAFDTSRTSRKGTYEWGIPFENKRLVRLTADEYYKLVGNEINHDYREIQDQRRAVPNQISVDEMADLMRKGHKFPTPWIHLNNRLGMIPHFQEGLHRLLAAKDVYGENARFPVYLGYEKGTEWPDIESGDIDTFIKNMNETRRKNQESYDNEQLELERKLKEEDKELARIWLRLNGADEVTDEDLNRYYKEVDDFFMDDD